ncbi:MAG: VCBS repeat-containing protein [bacterium]|nr:VCBS repeat-containing protein [bacterium]
MIKLTPILTLLLFGFLSPGAMAQVQGSSDDTLCLTDAPVPITSCARCNKIRVDANQVLIDDVSFEGLLPGRENPKTVRPSVSPFIYDADERKFTPLRQTILLGTDPINDPGIGDFTEVWDPRRDVRDFSTGLFNEDSLLDLFSLSEGDLQSILGSVYTSRKSFLWGAVSDSGSYTPSQRETDDDDGINLLTLATLDLNQDGWEETVVGTRGGKIYYFDELFSTTGDLLFETPDGFRNLEVRKVRTGNFCDGGSEGALFVLDLEPETGGGGTNALGYLCSQPEFFSPTAVRKMGIIPLPVDGLVFDFALSGNTFAVSFPEKGEPNFKVLYGTLSPEMTLSGVRSLDLGLRWLLAMEIGDFNNDERPDLFLSMTPEVVVPSGTIGDPRGLIHIYLSDAEGAWTIKREKEVSGLIYDIEVSDLDRDGLDDIFFLYFSAEAYLNPLFPEVVDYPSESMGRYLFSRRAAAFMSNVTEETVEICDNTPSPDDPVIPFQPGDPTLPVIDLGEIKTTCVPGRPYRVEIKIDQLQGEARAFATAISSAEASILRDEVWTQTSGPFPWADFDAKEKWDYARGLNPSGEIVAARANSTALKSFLSAATNSGLEGNTFTTKGFHLGTASSEGEAVLTVLEGVCPWPPMDFPVRGPFQAQFSFSVAADGSRLSGLQAAVLEGTGLSSETVIKGNVVVTDVGLEMKGGGPKGFGGCSLIIEGQK